MLIQNIDISRWFPAAIEIHKQVTLNYFLIILFKKNNVTCRPAEKRNHSDLSSISELDTSNSSPQVQSKKKKKKGKGASKKEQGEGSVTMTSERENCFAVARKELKEINTKLSNVISNDDVYLKEIIKDTFQPMKGGF